MTPLRRLLPAAALVLMAWTAHADGAPSGPGTKAPYQAVLIAGDDSLPVFDNAVGDVEGMIRRAGAATGVTRLSATAAAIAGGARPATLAGVLNAVAALHPAPGQACLVYATSHGVHARGVYLAAQEEVLTPPSSTAPCKPAAARRPPWS